MTQDFLDMGAESPWTKRNGNVGAPLDVKLPLGEIDSLRWGLDGQKGDMGSNEDISHLPFPRPMKKRKTHGPDHTVGTAVLIDKSLPLDPIPHTTLSQPATDPANSAIHICTADDELISGIVEIFPDISHQYVKDIITPHRLVGSTEGNFGGDRALTVKQDVLDYILTKGHYPKQEREKKSLGNMDEDEQNWDPAMTDAKDSLYYRNA
ncbi:hypothetical protein EYZ11_008015 [Aspergillus tanneri]|uniref:Uncharacterized protein n=1 Tax=Aspergillus tanneri TaxID=1220188 RepID=A0A4V3UNU3_9EURO|nr:hypothetical protein EYZ11_008015 [Aspergillus tanneri]